MKVSRHSALEARHRSLGADIGALGDEGVWNGVEIACTYRASTQAQHDAMRDVAGIFDMFGLFKTWVSGRNARDGLDRMFKRDLTKLSPGKSTFALLLDENGMMYDDCIIFHISDDKFLITHGEQTIPLLEGLSRDDEIDVTCDHDLHMISVQGPLSRDILSPHVNFDLNDLAYFCHRSGKIFDRPALISRTGYSGELGFEIFVAREDALAVWDGIYEHGEPLGMLPQGFIEGLEVVRVEAGLLFYPVDMDETTSPWEINQGFALSMQKENFRGKSAVEDLKGKERIRLVGLEIDHDAAVSASSALMKEGRTIGRVTSPVFSHRLGKSISLAHVNAANAGVGGAIEVDDGGTIRSARIVQLPFVPWRVT